MSGGPAAVSKQATCTGSQGSCPGDGCRKGDNPPYNHQARSCGFPALLSNTTVGEGAHLLNATHGWWPTPGTAIQPDVIIAATGACPATGITSDTNFFKSSWPVPGTVIDATDPKYGLVGVPTWAHGTSKDYYGGPTMVYANAAAGIQAVINAAAAIPNSIAYFPTGIYSINQTIVLPSAPHHYWVGGTRFQSCFSWTGSGTNSVAMFRVAPSAEVTLVDLFFETANISSPVVRILVEGSGAAPKKTNVTIDSVFLGTGQPGQMCDGCPTVKLQSLAPGDLVDLVALTGDVHSVGNQGTVLSGYHMDGIVILEPDTKPPEHDATPAQQGFFGEMARFAGGGPGYSYNTRITGGQTYVCGAYYQESSHAAFHFTKGSGGDGHVAIAAVKMFTFNWIQTLFEGWDGLFFVAGAHSCAQCFTDSKCNNTIQNCNCSLSGNITVKHVDGNARIAYTTTMPWYHEVDFDLGADAELTLLGNMRSDSLENHFRVPDITHANSNATVVEAYDLFRRLGRLDLQHHYPELGVRDVCSGHISAP